MGLAFEGPAEEVTEARGGALGEDGDAEDAAGDPDGESGGEENSGEAEGPLPEGGSRGVAEADEHEHGCEGREE